MLMAGYPQMRPLGQRGPAHAAGIATETAAGAPDAPA
jgi:hypothetical protein